MRQLERSSLERDKIRRQILLASARAFQGVLMPQRGRAGSSPSISAAILLVTKFGKEAIEKEEISLEEQIHFLMNYNGEYCDTQRADPF